MIYRGGRRKSLSSPFLRKENKPMKLNGVTKALVWLGLGGGIGFFAGYQVGVRLKKEAAEDIYERLDKAEKRNELIEQNYKAEANSIRNEYESKIAMMKEEARKALKAQREYLAGKDDEELDDSVMEEVPEMPEDPFPDDEDGDTDGDEEIQQLHPEDLRPYAITPEHFRENPKGYDKLELDYYTEDGVIFDPEREEKWTHPEQLLGIGWKERFNSPKGKPPIREVYVQNDTMEIIYKITRIDDSFERLYEEE
jgi:hypothetical protein